MKQSLILFILLLISFTVAQAQCSSGDTVADFTVVDVHGETHNLFSYLNDDKYVCIDFFGTSCQQCLELVPCFNNIYTNYGCNKSSLVLLAINYLNNNDEILEFEAEYGGIYPAISGFEGGGQTVYTEWQIQYWPQLILIKPNKTIAANISPINEHNIDSIAAFFNIKTDTCPTNSIYNKQAFSRTIKIYPNPSCGIINIKTPNQDIGNSEFKIINLSGIIVLKGNLFKQNTINVSSLKKGVYFIEINTNKTILRQTFMVE